MSASTYVAHVLKNRSEDKRSDGKDGDHDCAFLDNYKSHYRRWAAKIDNAIAFCSFPERVRN